MNKPLISVIVPVYCVEKYIHRCVDSILRQTYENLEIILVDDGSSDNCPAICDDYAKKDDRVKVIHQKNGGSSMARNVGMNMAEGRYIGFVDSDDWIEFDMYEELLRAILDKNADVAICSFLEETKDGTNQTKIDLLKYNSAVTLLEGTIVGKNAAMSAVWSKLYDRNLITGIGFVQGISGEDNVFMVDVLSSKPNLVFVDRCLYHYNKCNQNSITNHVDLKMEYGYFIFLSKYLKLPAEFHQNVAVLGQAKADILKWAIRCYVENMVKPQLSIERISRVEKYLQDDKNCEDLSFLKSRYRLLYWLYRHRRKCLRWYAMIRYGNSVDC